MSSLRIGMVISHLPKPGVKPGGVSVAAHRLADGLAGRGHDVRVWSYGPPPAGASYTGRLLPGGRFATTWLGKRLSAGYLSNLFHLFGRYGDRQVLLAHGDSLLLPLLGKPLVRVVYGSGLGEARSARSTVRQVAQTGVYLGELLTSLTQPCVAISSNTTKDLPMVRKVIPLGVDRATFRTGSAKAPVPTVMFVGTLGGRKRGTVLADWFTRVVRPAVPTAELVLVTEAVGPPTAGVTYRVGLREDELIDLYQRAWVYASPSTYEGFGVPYLEAMACGTPVVATPNPGSQEVLAEGRYGVLAPDSDFPHVVVRLLTDPAYRATMTAAGLDRAADLSLDRTLDRYEALLTKVVADYRWGLW